MGVSHDSRRARALGLGKKAVSCSSLTVSFQRLYCCSSVTCGRSKARTLGSGWSASERESSPDAPALARASKSKKAKKARSSTNGVAASVCSRALRDMFHAPVRPRNSMRSSTKVISLFQATPAWSTARGAARLTTANWLCAPSGLSFTPFHSGFQPRYSVRLVIRRSMCLLGVGSFGSYRARPWLRPTLRM